MSRITRRTALTLAAGVIASPAVNTVTTSGTASAAAPAPSGRNPVVRADLITTVTPSANWRVTAVAIRYAGLIDPRGGTIPPAAFQVTATVNRQTVRRTVTRVYPNTAAEVADRGRPGDYLIIELAVGDSGALAAGTDPFPLDRAYAIRQVADVTTPQGVVVLPASPLAVRNDGVLTLVVDDFTAGSFTDSAGFELDFRLRSPAGSGRDTLYPLVLTLHGGGEVADNNMTQLTANRLAVTFATPERRRRHPAFVLSPQIPLPRPMNGPDGTDWTDPRVERATVELIDTFVARYPVDTDRIYVVGPSSGGRGVFNLLPKHPGKFAAAIATAGWGDVSTMDRMVDVPLWVDHSIDDAVVPYREGRFGKPGSWTLMNALEAAGAKVTRGEWANNLPKAEFEARSRELLRTASATGSHVLFTSYPAGTTPVNPHFSWAQTYDNDVIIEWLFAQSRS